MNKKKILRINPITLKGKHFHCSKDQNNNLIINSRKIIVTFQNLWWILSKTKNKNKNSTAAKPRQAKPNQANSRHNRIIVIIIQSVFVLFFIFFFSKQKKNKKEKTIFDEHSDTWIHDSTGFGWCETIVSNKMNKKILTVNRAKSFAYVCHWASELYFFLL